jgi:catechol-2,3-dioxygenase
VTHAVQHPAGHGEAAAAAPPQFAHGVVQGIFEIQLVTASLEAMVAFYREVVGLRELFSDDRRGRTHLGLGTGQLILARENGEQVLAQWPGVPPRMYAGDEETVLGPRCHGPVHYAFHVDDRQWAHAVGRIAGDDSVPTRGPLQWGAGFQSLYFLDPDGNCAELICETAPEAVTPPGFRQ